MTGRKANSQAVKRYIMVLAVCILSYALMNTLPAQQLPLPEQWKKAIVPIEVNQKTENGSDTLITIGTGFLVHNDRGIIFVVTCKHVVRGIPQSFITFKTKDPDAILALPIGSEKFHFVYHDNPSIDLAISSIPSISGATLDYYAIGLDMFLAADSIYEGENVLFLGFPMAIGGEKATPVCRSGIVALKEESEYSFLIEGNAFPGNSGGPVFLRQSVFDFRTKSLGRATKPYFIGVVAQAITYNETAMSMQTGRPRITFEENAGLVRVIPSQYLLEMIKGR
jgi:hypothetical protein